MKKILFVAVVSLWACGPARIFPHGEIPSEERRVTAYFSSVGQISLENLTFDMSPVSVFNNGIETTPGFHQYTYSADYTNVLCKDTPLWRCGQARFANCSGSFEAEAGKGYQIRVVVGGSHVVEETGEIFNSGAPVGGGSCRNNR